MKNKIIYTAAKYFLGVGLVFMFNSDLFAQEQTATKEDRVTKELQTMKTDLTLTADQEAKVKTVLTSYGEKEKQLRDASKEDKEAARTKRAELQKQKDTDLKAVLTADQYQKYTAKKAEHKEGGHGDGHNGGGHGGDHKKGNQ